MISVTIIKHDKCYKEIHLDGHAKFAKFGKDIVCSAVSVLVINTINSIEEFTDDAFSGEAAENGGRLDVVFPEELSHDSILLLDSMVLGLKTIQKDYGSKYISLQCKEV